MYPVYLRFLCPPPVDPAVANSKHLFLTPVTVAIFRHEFGVSFRYVRHETLSPAEVQILQTLDTANLLCDDNRRFDVYFRDIIECVRALISDIDLCPLLMFIPERHYADETCNVRVYFDMHTGKWWWATQVSMLAHHTCAFQLY